MWDPDQYLAFADERSRPFFDLTGRIGAKSPRIVVDLGCGPGQLTAALAARWPDADILGIDSSAEMIAAARDIDGSGMPGRGTLNFRVEDVTTWEPVSPIDVIVSNAVFQWVPGHLELLPRWAGWLEHHGWLAFQVPGNFDQASHAVLRDLATSPRWQQCLATIQLNRQSAHPAEYLDLLARSGLDVDAWRRPTCMCCRGPTR
jgi:trans-aconitate 2-methyltransferase